MIALVVTVPPNAPVGAHARLLLAHPAPGSTVMAPPQVVRVWFKLDPNEELDPKRSAISVRDARGMRVDDGKGGVDLNDLDRASMLVRVKATAPGTYVVMWKAVSPPDLAVRQGTFRFTVAIPASLPALQLVSPLNGATVSSPVAVVFETPADLSKMTAGEPGMTMKGTHLHVDLDRRVTMPTLRQIVKVGAVRYRVRLGQATPGRHTIRLYWGDRQHRPMGHVQIVSITVK